MKDKDIIKILRSGGETPKEATVEQAELARLVIDSENFVSEYIKKNGTKAFLAERLRDGYIGQEDIVGDKKIIHTVRGRPYGTVVAIPKDDGVDIGVSYLASGDKDYPIVGLATALKRAVTLRNGENTTVDKPLAFNAQIKRFSKRATAYFYPDEYSYSRGKNPGKDDYSVYDPELQRRRLLILGDEAYNKSMCKPRSKEQLEKVRRGETDFVPGK